MELFPYQIDGAKWLASGENFLFDEMGLGKTAQVVRAADDLGARRVGVIAPAIARPVWSREFEKWGSEIRPEAISFAGARSDRWDLAKFDILAIDEGQNLGNVGSLQTRAVFGANMDGTDGHVARAGLTWLLTGTPMRGHPGQLWPMLHTLKGDDFPESYWDWTRRYCVYGERRIGQRIIRDIIGGKNLVELRDRLKGKFLRRLAKDVLDLPELRVDTIPIASGRRVEGIDDEELRLIVRSVVEGNIEFQETVELTRLRRAVALAKAEATIELVSWTDEPTVLFAYHHDVIDILCDALKAPRITGKEKDAERMEAVELFQTGNTQYLVCQIEAASTVITLTRGTWVVLVEPLWSPTDNWQAIKRCLRIGSERPVRASFVTLAGTVDEAVLRVLARKTDQIALTLGE